MVLHFQNLYSQPLLPHGKVYQVPRPSVPVGITSLPLCCLLPCNVDSGQGVFNLKPIATGKSLLEMSSPLLPHNKRIPSF